MRLLKVLLIVVVGSFMLIGCSGSSKSIQDMPSNADAANPKGPADLPGWYTNTPEEDDVFIYGTGTGDSRRMDIAVSKAKQSASVTISERISAHVTSQVKQFTQEAGMDENTQIIEFYQSTSKTVTDNTLNGLTIIKRYPYQKKDGTWTAYVLAGLKKGALNIELVNVIQNEEALYAEFKASQAFDDLEASLK